MSERRKLEVNANDSKNTRMPVAVDIGAGGTKTDHLAHLSRFGKIADLMIAEAKELGRPLNLLDIGCGDVFPLQILNKAHVIRKTNVVASYRGIDIDPVVTRIFERCPSMCENMNVSIDIQDLTVNPHLDLADESVDFAWTCEVIEHMKPEFVPAWLDDVFRVMRPGALLYVSTPNHDGSNDKLPIDHVYEWRYEELKTELESRWKLLEHTGTFIQLPRFRKANREHKRIPDELVKLYESRFDSFWLRNVLAAPYPEVANNVNWILRKPL